MKTLSANITTDVELILKTGGYIFDGVSSGFDKGRKLSPLPKFSQDNLLNIKYTGVEKKLLQNFMVESFTVAGVLNYDLEEKLKVTAAEILKREDTKDPKKLFLAEAKKIIPQYQYDGKIPPDGHLLTNFRTAVSSAYHGSMWQKITGAGIYAALQYKTREDSKVREAHRKLQDKIFYLEDEIWKWIFPPNGFNCRCYVIALRLEELKGKTVETPVRTEEETKIILKDADLSDDFARNSGMTHSIWNKWLDAELKNKDVDKIFTAMKEYAGKNMPAADQIVKESLKLSSKLYSASNEVWGDRRKGKNDYSSTINFIRIKQDYFEVITSTDGILSEVKQHDLSKLDEFRKGVLIKLNK